MQVSEELERTDPERAQLYFEGVDGPVVTRVRSRGPTGMTVQQPLPFLSLRSDVRDASGRAARIRSIRVCVEADTPHLVLELSYDRSDATVRFPIAGAPLRRRSDETLAYGEPRRIGRVDEHAPALDAEAADGHSVSRREDQAPIVFRLEPDDGLASEPAVEPPVERRGWLADALRRLL